LARPGADVVEVQLLERHLALAHDAAPSSLAAGCPSSAGASSTAGSASGAGSAAGSATAGAGAAGAGGVPAGGTGAGMPSPPASVGAFGLASCTRRVKA